MTDREEADRVTAEAWSRRARLEDRVAKLEAVALRARECDARGVFSCVVEPACGDCIHCRMRAALAALDAPGTKKGEATPGGARDPLSSGNAGASSGTQSIHPASLSSSPEPDVTDAPACASCGHLTEVHVACAVCRCGGGV